MREAYLAVVTVHIFAAMLWVGGTLFLVIVGAPALRAVEPESLREQLFEAIGMRFRYVGWLAVAVMMALSAVHDLALSPGRVREAKAAPDWPRRRRRLVLMARAGALAALVVVVAAVRLARS